MPISSTEISGIIQSQVGMFSASAAYAHAVSAQYGYQSHGGMGVNDPRQSTHQAQMGLHAGSVGGGMARMPGMAMGGLGMMSMFGFGPRQLDPFTMSMHMGGQGFARQGLAGAIGMGGAAMGAYMGMGAMGSWATNHMVAGAQNRGMLNSQMGQMFPGMNSQGLGMMSAQVESQARMGMGNLREITSVMQQGVHSGAIDTSTLTQFSQSFNKLMSNVRQVATVMNTSLQQAQQAMQSVSGMGITGDQAAGFLGTMKGIGQASNISPAGMMGVAQAGANFGQAAGIDMGQAATGAMVSAGVYGYTERNNLIKGITGAAQGRYTGAATRFLGSRNGRTVLGAMMTPTGEFDSDIAGRIAGGGYSWKQIQGLYNQNIQGAGARDMLNARGGELAGQFISEFGPQAIASPLRSLANRSSSPESMIRQMTGLTRNDHRAMEMLSSSTGPLRQKMLEEARAGFKEGSGGMMGITDIMSKAVSELTKPVRQQFQKLGASMTQYYQDAVQDVNTQLTGQGGSGAFSRTEGRGWSSQIQNLSWTGNTSALNQWSNRLTQAIGGQAGMQLGGRPNPTTWAGQFARDFTPMGFQLPGLGGGTQFSELPMGGLGLEQYQPGQTGLAFASAFRGFGGGRNIFGATGAVMSNIGQRITGGGPSGYTGLFGGSGSGFMGMGGHGLVGGTARLGGGALRVGGFLGRMGGGALGAVGVPLMAYDAITNQAPEAMRQYGMSGISAGAITGNNARLIESLQGVGVLGDSITERHKVGGAVGGLDAEAAQALGLTPLGGTFEDGGKGYGGTQGFLTSGGQKKIHELIAGMGGDHSAMIDALGGEQRLTSVAGDIAALGNVSDERRMKVFMEKTGANSSQAYQYMSGKGMFQGSLKKRFQASAQYRMDPESARDRTTTMLGHRTGAHITALLGKGGDQGKRIAEQLLGHQSGDSLSRLSTTLGVDEGTLSKHLTNMKNPDFKQGDGLAPHEEITKLVRASSTPTAKALSMNSSGLQSPYGGTGTQETDNAVLSEIHRTLSGAEGSPYQGILSRLKADRARGQLTTSQRSSYIDEFRSVPGFSAALAKTGGAFGSGDQMTAGDFIDKMKEPGALNDKLMLHTGANKSLAQAGWGQGTNFDTLVKDSEEGKKLIGYLGGRTKALGDESIQATSGSRMAAMAGGYASKNAFSKHLEEFNKGQGSYDPSSGFKIKDHENEAMKKVAGMFLGDDMTDEGKDRAITSLAKGGTAFTGRAAVVGANVRYYTKQWEEAKDSPMKFLSSISHNPKFNKLTKQEQAYLKDPSSGKGELTTRLESMLNETARDIFRKSGKTATEEEVEGLSKDLVSGSAGDKAKREQLITRLSTNLAPLNPTSGRGGGGAGAQEAVQGVLTALSGLADKLKAWKPPGQN